MRALHHDAVTTLAVTGTNGKTTTTSMLASVAAATGETPLCVTTVGARLGERPLPYDGSMESFIAVVEQSVAEGARTVCLEATSRALASGFARRWPPDVAVFTNLTRDHLDRHGTPEAYLAAKAALFIALPEGGTAVLNAADPASALLAEVVPGAAGVMAYAAGPPHHDCRHLPLALTATSVSPSREGTAVELADSALARALGGALRLRALGSFQGDNALAAGLAAHAAGVPAQAIRRGLEAFPGVEGRFEPVCIRPLVVVDYAHTPAALEATLATARRLVAPDGGRVTVVFGCGGDRDQGKRATMGACADASADRVLLTTDNPRTEPAERIARMVAEGSRGRATWTELRDRAEAIARAIAEARPQDAVVVAGKGHERVQVVENEERPFDDFAVAAEACGRRGLPIRRRVGGALEPGGGG